jgi:oxalate decarboxylase
MQDLNRRYPLGRRSLIGAAAAALSASAMGSRAAFAQTRGETLKGEQNHSASNPGPINSFLAGAKS